MATYALLLYAAVMGTMAWLQPDRYPWVAELATFGILLLVIPGCAVLSRRMSAIRETLGRQKSELGRALERIAVIADCDELTGLANRRCAQRHLQVLEAQAGRGHPGYIGLIDLDRFKQINDRHGHAVGDAVLVHFAASASASLRPGDVLARWGGEEFLLIFQAPDESAARATCERVRCCIEEAPLPLPAGPVLRFTVSIGLSRQLPGSPLHATLEAAGGALYRAKASGRNRVELTAG